MNRNLKAGFFYTISSFLSSGINIILLPIFSRIMSTSDFGRYNNFTSWYSILLVFGTLNLSSTLIRARFDFDKSELDDYYGSLVLLGNFASVITFFITYFLNVLFPSVFDLKGIHIIIMFFSMFFSPSISIYQTVQRIKLEYKKSISISLIQAFFTLVLSLFCVISFSDKLTGRILGGQLPIIVIGCILFVGFIKKINKFNKDYWKYAIKICLPYIPHSLSMNLLGSLDKIMITNMINSSATAMYSISTSCGSIVSIIITSVNMAYSPWLGENLHLNNHKTIRKFSYIYIFLFFLVCMFTIIFCPEIIYIIAGERYFDSVSILPIIILGVFCQFCYTMYVNVEQYEKKTVGMAIATILATGVNAILNYLLIPLFGYKAAAYTTFLSYLFLLLAHYYMVKQMGFKNIYNIKYMLLLIVFLTCFAILLIYYVYRFQIIRYIIAIILLLLLIYIAYITKKKTKENNNESITNSEF